MVQADGAVGRGRCAEVLEVGAHTVGKLGAEPLIKPFYVRHFFHDLHADGGAEQLRLGLLLALDFDDPCRLASLIGQQAELGDKARDGAHELDNSGVAVAARAEDGVCVHDCGGFRP